MNNGSKTLQQQKINIKTLNVELLKFNKNKIFDIIKKQHNEDHKLEKRVKNLIKKLYKIFKNKKIIKLNNKKLSVKIMSFLRKEYPHLNDMALQDFYHRIESKKLQHLVQYSLKNNNNDLKL